MGAATNWPGFVVARLGRSSGDPNNVVPEYATEPCQPDLGSAPGSQRAELPVIIGEFTGPWGADCKEPAALGRPDAQSAVAAISASSARTCALS